MQADTDRRPRWRLSGAVVLLALGLLPGSVALSDPASSGKFDHAITGFSLSGAHERTACESCHVNGVFQGTPTQCLYCHQAGSKLSSTSKPPNHVPTQASCDECHNTTATWAGARFNHFSSGGLVCAICHSGGYLGVRGPPASHIPGRQANCETCHRSTAIWRAF